MEPARKYKTFTYHTSVEWNEARQGALSAEGKPTIAISSPPEFKGVAGKWTPEDFFVASVEMCTMSTFLSFGERNQLPLKSYASSAEGFLEFVDGKYRFTKIIITPVVTVDASWTNERVEELFHKAHEHCLIGNSMTTSIVIEPTIHLS